ncbi:iron permease FTR1 family protein [[Synechococcus] sp. NIES-970]|uniref:FTR1 family iron permease n=1 Tax=Picosynechococcus sp. NKBG15041c TaxID=1407650 RepID=UPI000416B226|nr:FTR1 family protein [Picosynechococcus sp. NKBG15041c]BAW95209.1 iron permease FTR1 family protein [[Synechococcus] sp. NIES-970]
MDISAALPAFVITLREGFEAALVVGIVLACLAKTEQMSLQKWVYGGIVAGLGASVLVGWGIWGLLLGLTTGDGIYTPIVKQVLEGSFGVVAIAMLSWMLIWMTRQAKSLKAEIEGALQGALQKTEGVEWAVFSLIFIAVLREGFETVIFMVAQFQSGWVLPGAGAIAGLLVATILGIFLFALGARINVKLFFQVMGIFLLLIIAGLVVGVLKHIDQAIALFVQVQPQYQALCISPGPACVLGVQLWDWSETLPDKQFPGILLKSLLGYRQKIYLAQAIAYVLFLTSVGTIYLQSLGLFYRPKESS